MYEQALVSFDYAIICDEKFVGAYFELAKTLEKLGRYNEAISFYEITLSIDDPTSFAWRPGCHKSLWGCEVCLAPSPRGCDVEHRICAWPAPRIAIHRVILRLVVLVNIRCV